MQKKKIIFLPLLCLALTGCTLSNAKAGITVKSSPDSTVFINNKQVGKTPYKTSTLSPGEYEIKLQSESGEWNSNKIRITTGTEAYINRTLNKNLDAQSGYTVSLEQGKGVQIVTVPTAAQIFLDNQLQNVSPYVIPSITNGKHEIKLSKEDYTDITIPVKGVEGYKLVIYAQLKSNNSLPEPTVEPQPTPDASASASPKSSPTTSAKASPTTSPKTSPSASASATLTGKTVTILSTPTGWLRVRDKAGTEGKEIAKVNTGEKYNYEEQLDTGWTIIILSDGTKGYVVSKYVKIGN